MSDQYPLTKSLGVPVLKRSDDTTDGSNLFVRAADLERALANGWELSFDDAVTGVQKIGRVVCERPILQDSAESLLREFLAHHGGDAGEWYRQFSTRAKRLLGEK